MVKVVYCSVGPSEFMDVVKSIMKEENRGKLPGSVVNNVHWVYEDKILKWELVDELIDDVLVEEKNQDRDQYIVTNSILGLVSLVHHLEVRNVPMMVFRNVRLLLWEKEHDEDMEFLKGGGLAYLGRSGDNMDEILTAILAKEFFCATLPYKGDDANNDPFERFVKLYNNLKYGIQEQRKMNPC